jgi:hypothetical protein
MAAALGHAVLLGLPLFLVFRLKGVGQRHVVRRTRVCSRRRAGRRPDLADGASGASHERVGRWRADGHQWGSSGCCRLASRGLATSRP